MSVSELEVLRTIVARSGTPEEVKHRLESSGFSSVDLEDVRKQLKACFDNNKAVHFGGERYLAI